MNTERRPVHMPPDAASLRALVEMHRESADYREALARVTAAQEPAPGDAAQPPSDRAWQPVAAAQRPAPGVTVEKLVEIGRQAWLKAPISKHADFIEIVLEQIARAALASVPAAPGLPAGLLDRCPSSVTLDGYLVITADERVALRELLAVLRSLPTAAADVGPDPEAVEIAADLPRIGRYADTRNERFAVDRACNYVRRKAAP